MCKPWAAAVIGRRADIQNDPGAHRRDGTPRHFARTIERPLEIDLNHRAKAVRTQVLRRYGEITRCVVEKDVDRPRHPLDGVEGGLDGGGITHIHRYLNRLAADGLDGP